MRYAALVVFAAASCPAQVLEDFEHGNELLWLTTSSTENMTLTPDAAHSGDFGAEFGNYTNPWRTRADIATAPGNSYYAFVRCRGGAPTGRIYLGVGAGTGTCAAGLCPNTGDLRIAYCPNYQFLGSHQTVPFVPQAGIWYVLGVEWAANGALRAVLYDESMTTLLAATDYNQFGFTTPGGMALSGFTSNDFSFNDMDDIRVVPDGCYADCNGSGQPTVADFGCFQTRFVAMHPYADCNGDWVFTVADFGCFQTRFVKGCP